MHVQILRIYLAYNYYVQMLKNNFNIISAANNHFTICQYVKKSRNIPLVPPPKGFELLVMVQIFLAFYYVLTLSPRRAYIYAFNERRLDRGGHIYMHGTNH